MCEHSASHPVIPTEESLRLSLVRRVGDLPVVLAALTGSVVTARPSLCLQAHGLQSHGLQCPLMAEAVVRAACHRPRVLAFSLLFPCRVPSLRGADSRCPSIPRLCSSGRRCAPDSARVPGCLSLSHRSAQHPVSRFLSYVVPTLHTGPAFCRQLKLVL